MQTLNPAPYYPCQRGNPKPKTINHTKNMNIKMIDLTSLAPTAAARIEAAANRNIFYPRHALKFALIDRNGEFHGCFTGIGKLEEKVEALEDSEGWINGPTAVAL